MHISDIERVQAQAATATTTRVPDATLQHFARHGLARRSSIICDEDIAALNMNIGEIAQELIERRAADATPGAPPPDDMPQNTLEFFADQHATMQAQIEEMSNLVRGIHRMLGGAQKTTGGWVA